MREPACITNRTSLRSEVFSKTVDAYPFGQGFLADSCSAAEDSFSSSANPDAISGSLTESSPLSRREMNSGTRSLHLAWPVDAPLEGPAAGPGVLLTAPRPPRPPVKFAGDGGVTMPRLLSQFTRSDGQAPSSGSLNVTPNPCPAFSKVWSSVGTPAFFSAAYIARLFSTGTSVSAVPWTKKVGGVSAVTLSSSERSCSSFGSGLSPSKFRPEPAYALKTSLPAIAGWNEMTG